jgi:hypothetical protein
VPHRVAEIAVVQFHHKREYVAMPLATKAVEMPVWIRLAACGIFGVFEAAEEAPLRCVMSRRSQYVIEGQRCPQAVEIVGHKPSTQHRAHVSSGLST